MTAYSLDDLATTVPLSWLLARRELGLRLVVPGQRDPEVGIAHAIELPDPVPWLRGGELVLTTGIRLPRTRAAQSAYVEGLAVGGAAALAFGVGMRFDAIPSAITDACVAHALPLIEVPLPTPFVAIARAITDRLAELRTLRLQEVLEGQRALTRSALRGGAAGVARTLARLLRAGVLVAGPDLDPVASQGPAPSRDVLRAQTAGGPHAVSLQTREHAVELLPFGSRPQTPAGWLCLQRSHPLLAADRLLVQHAAALLALHVAEPDAREREPGLLLAGLVGGFNAAEVLAGMGLPARGGLRVVAHDDEPWMRQWERRRLPGLHAPVRVAMPGLLDTEERGWVSLIADVDLDRLRESPPGGAGVSRAHPAEDLAHAWREARAQQSAVDRAEGQGSGLGIADDDPGELARSAAAGAVAPWLRALASYDEAHGAELTDTLRGWLARHGNADRAAAAIGCHRHTMRHRLQRIGEVAGLELEDARTRALLTLALVEGAAGV